MANSQKNVVIFGVFDGIHDGHRFFIENAARLGDSISIVVAQDKVIKKMKGHSPEFSLDERMHMLSDAFPKATVMPGDLSNNAWGVLEEINPSIIALGYDQKKLLAALREYYRLRENPPEIITIEDLRGNELHSSILRKNKKK